MDEDYMEVLVARFWGGFGSGAGMPFNDECVEVAHNKGYYETVWENAPIFKEHPEKVDEALRCCWRAGHLAAERAIREDRTIIVAADFVYACDEVEGRIARIRQRAASNGNGHHDTVVTGGVCSALV